MQKRFTVYLFVVLAICSLVSCGDSATETASAGITINGIISSDSESISALPAALFRAAPGACPDDDEGGYAINLEPVDGSFKIATKYVRFLKADSDDSYEVESCTNSTGTAAETNMVTLNSSASTICSVDEISADALATFDGLEMALYFVEMTVSMIVPQLAEEKADYTIRIYFNNDTDLGIYARDVLVYDAAQELWGWVNWNDTTQLSYVGVDDRPTSLLDAFSNDEFWCADCAATPELCPADEADWRQCSAENPTWSYKDPVTISTEETGDGISGGDFTMSGTFTIAEASESHTITMSFNVADTLTAWETEADIEDEVHTLDITQDCGFNPLFPEVTVTETAL